MDICEDCPPVGFQTDKTRCSECPRRLDYIASLPSEGESRIHNHPWQLAYTDHDDYQSLTSIVDANGNPLAVVETGLGRNHNEGVARRIVRAMNEYTTSEVNI